QRYEPVSRSSGGLVNVLHVGRNEAEGYFYYVMELADDSGQNPKSEIRNPKETQIPKSEQEIAGAIAVVPLEVGLPSDLGFRVSDFYAPRTLRSDLKRLSRLPTAACLRLALDVTSGLAQLHRHGLVHRDVKPGNIIYANGRAKLADIGLVSV